MAADDDAGFLTRWSRRKALARSGSTDAPVPTEPAPAPSVPMAAAPSAARGTALPAVRSDLPSATGGPPGPPAQPAPTMHDVAGLTNDSDFSRFVARNVDPGVQQAALKKLFSDPHFNVMDRLDVYIDDYGQPDPLPAGMLRQMAQSRMLGLFDDEPVAEAGPAGAAVTPSSPEAPSDPAPLSPPDRADSDLHDPDPIQDDLPDAVPRAG